MPKIVDPVERRQNIVDATWMLIADEGWDAVTMRHIAERLGCTTGRITHWFDAKDDILMAVLDELSSTHRAGLVRLRAKVNAANGDIAKLATAITETLPIDEQERRDWRVWLAFWNRATNSPQIANHCRALHGEWRDVLADGVRDSTTTDQAEIDHRTQHLLALIDGLGVHMLLEPERYRIDVVEQIIRQHLSDA